MEVKIQAKEIGPSNWEAVISSPATTVKRTMFGSSANRAVGNVVARHAREYGIKYTTKEYGPSNWGATLTDGQATHTFWGQCENDAIGNTIARYGHFHGIEVVVLDRFSDLKGSTYDLYDPRAQQATELSRDDILEI